MKLWNEIKNNFTLPTTKHVIWKIIIFDKIVKYFHSCNLKSKIFILNCSLYFKGHKIKIISYLCVYRRRILGFIQTSLNLFCLDPASNILLERLAKVNFNRKHLFPTQNNTGVDVYSQDNILSLVEKEYYNV